MTTRHPLLCRLLMVAASAVASLSGCTSGGPADVVAAATEIATGSPTCINVPADVLSHLASGAQPGLQLRPDTGMAVKARPGVFVIAARFHVEGGAVATGVWTAPALTATSAPLLVADAAASAVTTWGSVEEFPGYGVALEDPALAAARRCLTR